MSMDYAKAIEEIGRQLGLATDKILPYYVKWYTMDALVGVVVGLGLITGSIITFLKIKNKKLSDDEDHNLWAKILISIALGISTLIGLLFICGDIPTLFAPEAKAFYKLISHIKGN
jgi:NAD/NADP transhydrogenase beta subunit